MPSNLLFSLERIIRGRFETPKATLDGHVILASFPKVGSTYMRFLVSNIYREITGSSRCVDWNSLEYFSPSIRDNNSLRGTASCEHFPVFLKTHFAYLRGFSDYKRVVMTRNAIETMVSYKDYLESEHGYKFRSNMHFLSHWRYGVEAYCSFYKSWSGKYDVLVDYQELVKSPDRVIEQLFQELFGRQLPSRTIGEAIRKSSRENMKRLREVEGDPYARSTGYQFVGAGYARKTVVFTELERSFITETVRRRLGRDSPGLAIGLQNTDTKQ